MNAIAHSPSQANMNPRLRPFLLKGRELSYPVESYIPFFSNIPGQALSGLVTKTKTVRYVRLWTMDAKSNRNNSMYIILSGKVTVLNGEAENTFLINDVDSSLREIALLSDNLASSSIVTFERAVFATVTKFEFVNWLLDYPEVTFNLMELSEKNKKFPDTSDSLIGKIAMGYSKFTEFNTEYLRFVCAFYRRAKH